MQAQTNLYQLKAILKQMEKSSIAFMFLAVLLAAMPFTLAAPVCGNNIAEAGEACDGTDSMGPCAAFATGFVSGSLNCRPDCSGYMTSHCVAGDIVIAASCDQNDVQNAINAATDGDIVEVPAGNCTWDKKATVTKGIFIKGAGARQTIITATAIAGTLFDVDLALKKNFRISGFGFSGNASWAYITLDGSFSSVRVDHIDFEGILGSRGVMLNYYGGHAEHGITGLFDHLNITSHSQKTFLQLYGTNNAWNRPDNYGSGDFIFLEDNNVSGTGGATLNFVDGECGARFVARNNNLVNAGILYHDTGSTPGCRSTRLVEIYDNNFSCSISRYPSCGWTAMSFRGGTGVYYNNKIPSNTGGAVGYDNGAATQLWRSYTQGGFPWNTRCDGIFDPICSDFRSHCSEGTHKACSGNYDCSGEGTCSIRQCASDTDCGAGATCLGKTDGQLDSSGWPCRDQTGRGQDDPVTHGQAISPAFWWNNKSPDGRAMNVVINSHGIANFPFILNNRDFYADTVTYDAQAGLYEATFKDDGNRAMQWSYRPYPYPHPLSVESVSQNHAPAIILTAPPNGASYSAPASIKVSATAGDTDGAVEKVEFFSGAALLGAGSTAPYSYTWNNVAAGTYTLSAKATDNLGASATTNPVTIIVSAQGRQSPDDDLDGVPNAMDRCPKTAVTAKNYVNVFGCSLPIAAKFDIKPDFNATDINGLQNLELGVSQYGKISYTNKNILLVKTTAQNEDERLDIDADLNITQSRVTLNQNNLPQLNQAATITLYNTSFNSPKILRDGEECKECTIHSYDRASKTLAFSVPGF